MKLLSKLRSRLLDGPQAAAEPTQKQSAAPAKPAKKRERNTAEREKAKRDKAKRDKAERDKAEREQSGRKKTERKKSVHENEPAKPAWSIDQFEVPPEAGKVRFHDFDLPLQLMQGIADLGFHYCSPIQAQILPHTLAARDAIGKAQTGTGKTAAFLVTLINQLVNHPLDEERYVGEPRALVLAPTRELAVQIGSDSHALCRHLDLKTTVLIGGADMDKQINSLRREVVDILVVTPGRLIDFIDRGEVRLDMIEILVIDEADRMLDMGFIPQVRRIISKTPHKSHRQTLLFSATFDPDILNLADRWTDNPIKIEIEPENVAADAVTQRVYLVSEREKFSVLRNILRTEDVTSALVFANRRDQVRRLHERLQKSKIECGILSGEVPQGKRTRTLERFKSGELKVLVATDVAGRGIHVEGISHVINYNLPEDPEDYVHRIGRTGRAGAKGTSISLACETDSFMLPEIERLLGRTLDCEQPPAELL